MTLIGQNCDIISKSIQHRLITLGPNNYHNGVTRKIVFENSLFIIRFTYGTW